jgi:hypothetical protein
MERVGRECVYETGPNQLIVDTSPTVMLDHSGHSQASISIPSSTDFDPFQYPNLRDATLDLSITRQASKTLGDVSQFESTAARYFASTFLRMPIISRKHFLGRVPTLYSHPRASLTLLCLSIHLVIQRPDELESSGHHAQNMQSSLYIMIKSFLGVLQSVTMPSLELIQAMVLTVFYEVGHGIYPAASISIAACARAARAIGLNKPQAMNGADSEVATEQRRRVWWAIFNLDKFINLCTGDRVFAADDPRPDDILPMELEAWQNDVIIFTLYQLSRC